MGCQPLRPGTGPAGFPFLSPYPTGAGLGRFDDYLVLGVLSVGRDRRISTWAVPGP